MSEPSIRAAHADIDVPVEQAVQIPANRSAAWEPSPARARENYEQTTEGLSKDLLGRVLSRLEFEFASLFREESP
jgi:hypothetical protein